jgi:hypothetical protein
MKDEEKLQSPAFESMPCGVSVTRESAAHGPVETAGTEYATFIYNSSTGAIDSSGTHVLPDDKLGELTETGPVAIRAATRKHYKTAGRPVAVASFRYVIANVSNQSTHPIPGLPAGGSNTLTGAEQALRDYLASHPSARSELQVLAMAE